MRRDRRHIIVDDVDILFFRKRIQPVVQRRLRARVPTGFRHPGVDGRCD